ncbi:MAG: thioredoxin domain-containing protein [Desulfovibrionaceae bacterium]|jgi:protein-disulfide isomerase|nr:thioredoxin domain-containing protein [Desulfovibrionaceae bacterium]
MSIRRILCLCCIALLLPMAAPAADQAEMKAQLETILKENPSLILDVLRAHSEEVLGIVQEGSNIRRERAMIEEWKEQIKNPVKVDQTGRHVRGNAKGDIQVVEFSDFQCPYCGRGSVVVKELMAKYPGRVGVTFHHLPLKMHNQAEIAARCFEAAMLQDPEKAWKLHDAMFGDRETLSKDGEKWILEQAGKIGLDTKKLAKDAKSSAVSKVLEKDKEQAKKLDINGTPTFVVNGVVVGGAVPLEDFDKLLKLEGVLK